MNRIFDTPRFAVAAAFVCLAASCASYNDRIAVPLAAFERGDFATAETQFQDRAGSAFLEGAEAGMAAFAAADFDRALVHFHAAQAAGEDAEERGILGLGKLSETALSLAINESQNAYEGEGYERVMLHAMLGLCYLAKGAPEDVLVEARRVDELLTGEEQLYEAEYRAGGIGHLLSAIAYELIGKPGEAYIDYERMYDKGLGGKLVEAALLRLSDEVGRDEEHDRWMQTFGDIDEVPEDWPSIVVIGGLGMGPAKYANTIQVPVNRGMFAWSVPSFDDGSAPTSALDLVFPSTSTRVRSAPIENVATVAQENLQDRIGWLAARSAARGLLKRQLADQMRDNKNGALLGALADVFTFATERADLRTWRTLPQSWVAARAFVPPNEPLAVELHEVGGARVALGSYELLEGETMFVLARALDSGLVAHVVGGERTDTQPSESIGASTAETTRP